MELVGAFWLVSLLFVFTPGADWAYAITAGLRHPNLVPAVAGLVAGHVVATLAVAGGVAALMAGAPLLLTALTAVGAAYLIWLGVSTLAHPATPQAAHDTGCSSRPRQALKGFGVSGLNPKVFLLFLALLPQFTDPAGTWPMAAQIVALGTVHVATCAVVYTLVGVGARVLLQARPLAARAVSRFSGAAMVAIGAFLLIQQAAV